MSQENVELVRRYWQCLDRALERHWAEPHGPVSKSLEREGVFDLFHRDAKWISTFGSDAFRGGQQVLRGLDDWLDAGDEWRVEAEEVVVAPEDRVLAVVRVSIRGRGSGVPVEQRFYTVCGIREGRIALIHDFMDRQEALEAVGLRE